MLRLVRLIVVGVVAAASSAAAAPPNQIDDAIRAAPPDQQAKFLGGVVAGCQGVNAYFAGISGPGPFEGTAVWDVQCADGRAYSLGIGPDGKGTPQTTDCQTLKAAGGGECFKPRKR